jgi:hypothetical protein
METDKSPDLVPSAADAERKAILNHTTKPVLGAEQIELDKVLEEMAEIIEAEGGNLTP